jgi:hypothetical protein
MINSLNNLTISQSDDSQTLYVLTISPHLIHAGTDVTWENVTLALAVSKACSAETDQATRNPVSNYLL